MSRMITVAPVRKSVVVNATQQKAFDVFTSNMTRWWPATHTILKAPLKTTVLEPRKGGRWYQIGEDNSECGIGHVLAWEPPARALLAWRINADWQYDPDLTTEVEVRFIAEGENRTRVELEHRHLERMGEKGEAARASVDSPGGWGSILESFKQTAEA
jgi:hypothetical protein